MTKKPLFPAGTKAIWREDKVDILEVIEDERQIRGLFHKKHGVRVHVSELSPVPKIKREKRINGRNLKQEVYMAIYEVLSIEGAEVVRNELLARGRNEKKVSDVLYEVMDEIQDKGKSASERK